MENQGQTFARLYHQALVNPKEVSLADFNLLLSKYPYSHPLHFALERRKFLSGELTKLGQKAILFASSPNWLYDYVQLPVKDIPFFEWNVDESLKKDESAAADEVPVTEAEATSEPLPVSEEESFVAEDIETATSESLPVVEEAPAEAEAVVGEDITEGTLATPSTVEEVPAEEESFVAEDIETAISEPLPVVEEAPAEAVVGEDITEETLASSPTVEEVPTEEESFVVEDIETAISEPSSVVDEVPVTEEEAPAEAEAVVGGDITEETLASSPTVDEVPAKAEIVAEENMTEETTASSPVTDEVPAKEESVFSVDADVIREQEAEAANLSTEEQNTTLETLVHEGIGGGDYFALHGKEIRWEANVGLGKSLATRAVATKSETEKEEDVSLYNDELMPYSFRWWLHKTRLEYADTYQPFASAHLPTNKKSAFDPIEFDKIVLDQQIRENIIHLQKPEDKLSEEVKQRAVPYPRVDKTSAVIEKFIREEPQIQPPPADQLNMENKARKSSEEQFDLVTETLANIYASQGMYVKAIEVYKKLILKFPEKKSYFASRIQELEEKLY